MKPPLTQTGQAATKKDKLITKARKDENTKKNKINFVLSEFRVFVVKKFFCHKMRKN